ncbi:MAG: superoxide dismutase [Bacilli bacterium]|nr:superoxide dismutase [Bacilli bacterium]
MYTLMDLPYPYNGLEPQLDEEVIKTHYTKHYTNYLNNLNKVMSKYEKKYSLKELPKHIEEFEISDRGEILYNVGGVLNHNLYWLSMDKEKSNPQGNLLNKINLQYGNFENFRKDFNERAKNLVGSGYTFLVSNNHGDLTIVNMINQETPISYNLTQLFTIALCEHS